MYGVVSRAHSVRGEPRIQRNANREVATRPVARIQQQGGPKTRKRDQKPEGGEYLNK